MTLDEFERDCHELEAEILSRQKKLYEMRIQYSELVSGLERGDRVIYREWRRGFVDWIVAKNGYPILVFRPERDCGRKSVDGGPSLTYFKVHCGDLARVKVTPDVTLLDEI